MTDAAVAVAAILLCAFTAGEGVLGLAAGAEGVEGVEGVTEGFAVVVVVVAGVCFTTSGVAVGDTKTRLLMWVLGRGCVKTQSARVHSAP